MISDWPLSSGRTGRDPTCQKALRQGRPVLKAAGGVKPDGGYLPGFCRAPHVRVMDPSNQAEVCVLCCQKCSTVAVCDECKEHYCTEVLTPTLV